MNAAKVAGETLSMITTAEITSSPSFHASDPGLHAAPTRGTILLVEDDRSIRRYLEVILTRAGYKVLTAADGLEAMKAALGSAIDAVVTDAVMPHLNGYELCRFLRRHPKFSRLPVILLSGLERADSSQDAEARADIYLAKPVRPDELTGSLARLLLKAAA
jgi:DNA-binding response OmpR family regulator